MQTQSETMSPTTGDQPVGTELKSDAQQLGSTAINRVHSEVDARKGAAVSQAKSVSSAIERAAGELDEGAPAWLRSAFQQGAQQVQRFADAIEQKDSRQMVEEVNSFARNSPGTFLAGCAAAGFAAARILKAGGSSATSENAAGSNAFGNQAGGQDYSTAAYESSYPQSNLGSRSTGSSQGDFV